jgi:hypothetical protein
MAGFGVFRTYQKASMVALAILAMLAFFVLPPLLQYGGQSASLADTPVAKWNGGELREQGLDRAVTMKLVLNRFLAEAAMAAGRDPAQAPRFPAEEQAVVRTMLLAEEGTKNGIVVSDAAINDFLAKLTNGQVRADQFEQIMMGLRAGGAGVSQNDLFEALRHELLAQNMLILLQRGFSGDPPGLRWDYFRRMSQSATAEVVPIDVRSFGDQIKAPGTGELRTFFEDHKEDLPDPRSEKPGFREPHRAKVEYLVAKRGLFVDEISKEITDAEVAEFYEKNKATQFRARPGSTPAAEPPTEPAAEAAGASEPAVEEKPADTAPPPAATEPQSEPTPPADAASPAAEPAPATETATETGNEPAPAAAPEPPADKPAEGNGAALSRSPFRQVAFQAPDAAADQATSEPAAAATTDAVSAPAQPDAATSPAATPDAAAADEAVQYEPLEAVAGQIRTQLATQRANVRIDNVFDAVALDLAKYAEESALWKARGEALGQKAPLPPDVKVIAEVQGLEPGETPLQSADEAFDVGGIGRSFDFVPDPGSRFGIRQQNWVEMVYGQGAVGYRAMKSRDMEGARYLSWKTVDEPEFVPTFETARPNVEKAWKIVKARGMAQKRAEEIVAKSEAAESLERAIAGDESLQAFKIGPFFWMSPQAAASGMAQISQPAGVVIPGNEFMSAVFSLEPGGTAVAFNEPKTVCYVIRLIDVEPSAEVLRERFVETKSDPRSTAVAAQDEFSRSFGGWIEGLESRYQLQWKRKPRR